MNGLDLDRLRSRWSTSQQQIDASLALDLATLRATLARRTQGAFRRHSRGLLLSLTGAALVLLALVAFLVAHVDDAIYRFLALPLLLLAGAEFGVQWRQWRALRQLDFSAPVLSVQQALDVLRARRLRMTRWIMLTSVLLWLPLVLVVCKGVFGIDLLNWLHPSVIYVNLAIGIAFIPLAMTLAAKVAQRFGHRPGFQRFLEDLAGASWSRARAELDSQLDFERTLDVRGAAAALAAASALPLSGTAAALLQQLRRRLLASILVWATLVLLTGAFNAAHGGQLRLLLPALLLHAVWLVHLVTGIAQRHALGRMTGARSAQLRDALVLMLGWRERITHATLVATPLLALPLIQVLGAAWFNVDALAALPWSGIAALAIAALALSGALGRRWRRPMRIIESALNAISGGTISAMRRLLAALD